MLIHASNSTVVSIRLTVLKDVITYPSLYADIGLTLTSPISKMDPSYRFITKQQYENIKH